MHLSTFANAKPCKMIGQGAIKKREAFFSARQIGNFRSLFSKNIIFSKICSMEWKCRLFAAAMQAIVPFAYSPSPPNLVGRRVPFASHYCISDFQLLLKLCIKAGIIFQRFKIFMELYYVSWLSLREKV